MPGNEVGDRVHNFFQQGNLSQNQHHSQSVEGNWTVLNNNPWGGSDRQVGGLFSSKNYNTHQADSERGQGNQFPLGLYGLNFAQSNPRPEFFKGQPQNQLPSLNGFIHAPEVSHTRHNEANIMGMDMESERCYPTSRGFPTLDSQQRSGPQHSNSNSMSFRTMESPVNFDFLGNQQQMSAQQPGPLQSLPGQQSGMSDIQQMQQQFMLKQMQELQRQNQLQQLEALQRNSLNQIPGIPSQIVNHPSTFINETSMHEGPSFPWSSQVMAGNPNWLQRGASAAIQGYSNGVMITPEQGQAPQFVGLVPPQASQSLYGVPVSSPWAAGSFLQGQVDKSVMQYIPIRSSSPSAIQRAMFPEQTSIREGANASKLGFENRSSLQRSVGHSLGDVDNVEYFNQTLQRDVSMQESGGRLDLDGSSETLPEKTVKHVASSQAAVALDPTEEKILFGSDDNIWEAFGGSPTTVTGSSNHLDGAFPSLQSGSWSALMQSAVAECANSNVAPQGLWSGVGVQNSGSLAVNQHSSISQDSDSAVLPAFLNQPRVSLPAISTQQSSEEGRNWLTNSQPQAAGEARQVENAYSSAELSSKGITSSWNHQKNLPLQGSQSINSTNAFRIIESTPHNEVTTSKAVQGLDHDRIMRFNVGHAGTFSSHNSAPNANIRFLGSTINSKDEAATHTSSTFKVNQDPNQKLSENRNLNFWRTVSSAKSGMDELKYHQLGQSPLILDSSLNSSVRGGSETRETRNADRRENSSDSHSSNISQHAPSGSFRDNMRLDVGTNGFPGEKQMLSGPGGVKSLGPRKFQYHPMGDMDIDEEPVYGGKHLMHSEAMVHPVLGGLRSQEEQLTFFRPATNNSLSSVKGLASSNRGDATASSGHPSSTFHPGYMPGASVSNKSMPSSQNMLELLHKVDQSNEQNSVGQLDSSISSGASEGEASDGTVRQPQQSSASQSFGLQLAPPSQGLLVPNFMVAGENSSRKVKSASLNDVPSVIENKTNTWMVSDASVRPLPPLQQTSNGGTRSDKSGAPMQFDAESFPSNILAEPFPSKMQGNLTPVAPGSGYLRRQLQIQQMTDAGEKIINDQHRQLAEVSVASTSGSTLPNNLASQREVSQLTSLEQHDVKPPIHQNLSQDISTSRQLSVYDVAGNANFSMIAPAVSANDVTQQQLGAQSVDGSNLSMPCQQNNSMEPHPSSQQEQVYEDSIRRKNAVASHAIVKREENPEREVDAALKFDDSLPKFAATQREIEAFGRSLRPTSRVPDNYSVPQHMQVAKAAEMGHSDRHLKRFKGSDVDPDAEYIAGNAGQTFSGGLNCVLVSTGDAKVLNTPPEACNDQDTGRASQMQCENVFGQDKLSVGQNLTCTDTVPRVEHSQISQKMVPTLFDQYGTLKNGQLLPVHDASRSQTISNLQQQFINSNSKNFVADHSMAQLNVAIDTGNLQHSATTLIMGNRFCSPPSVVPSAIVPIIEPPRLKKRKSATADLLPWREVILGSQRIQTMSSAVVEWARAANRLIEKPEDETDISGDKLLLNRSRRRLILTTQLMQQLLRPPPALILSLDATSNYETVAYFVARLALGDACSMTCCLASDSYLGRKNSLSEKHITSGRIRDQYLSKLVEDFTNRAKKVEDLLRSDKQALTLDLRLECQDLERLSVINRFAKFHGRVQADGDETSSSSSTAGITQKPVPQRYVTAHPMPMNLPDGIQCLSL